jgi:hypothetical protein
LLAENSGNFAAWNARSVLVDDDIYFIVEDKVQHSNWQLPAQVIGNY